MAEENPIVIVGGGIFGCSLAYHLARQSPKHIILLEQNKLAGGTTWHAAGMVGRLRVGKAMSWMNQYSASLYQQLQEQGHDCGWQPCGSLMLARKPERMEQYKRSLDKAKILGIVGKELNPEECRSHNPWIRSDDLVGGIWLPDDGMVDPTKVTLALAEEASKLGVEVHEATRVEGFKISRGRISEIQTSRGTLAPDQLVIAAGMWSRQLAKMVGESVPLYPVQHQYAVTKPVPGLDGRLPCTRDPDGGIFVKSDHDSLVLGCFRKRSKAWDIGKIPSDFSFALIEPDTEAFANSYREGRYRFPVLGEVELEKLVNGPESFTPDNSFLLGRLDKQVNNLFIGAAFNSAGIASAAGASALLAELMTTQTTRVSLDEFDPYRFPRHYYQDDFLRKRVTEVLGLHYQMAWPNRQYETGRGLHVSPLHKSHQSLMAYVGESFGCERPLWYRSSSKKISETYGPQTWEDEVGEEWKAAKKLALYDASADYQMFAVCGPKARTMLNEVSTHLSSRTSILLDTHQSFLAPVHLRRLSEEECFVFVRSSDGRAAHKIIQEHCQRFSRTQAHWPEDRPALIEVVGESSSEQVQKLGFDENVDPWIVQRVWFGETSLMISHGFCLHHNSYLIMAPPAEAGDVFESLLKRGFKAIGWHVRQALRVLNSEPILSADGWGDGEGAESSYMTLRLNDATKRLHGGEPVFRGDCYVGEVVRTSVDLDSKRAIAQCQIQHSAIDSQELPLCIMVAGQACKAQALE